MTLSQLVGRERSRLGVALAARGVALALAILALVIAAGVFILGDARWIRLPALPLLAWALALLGVAAALWWAQRDARRSAAEASIARAIESERSLRAGSLRGVLEAAESGELGAHAASSLAARLGASGPLLAPALHRRALQRGALALVAALAAFVFLGAARSRAPDGWRAIRHPVGALTGEILAPLRIVDVPRSVMRGEKLRVTVSAPERRDVTLRLRSTGKPWSTINLPVKGDAAATLLGPMDADVAIVASDGRVSSDTVVIRVTDRPFVGDVAIRATYPSYLGRPPETIPVGESVPVPRGTALAISGRASTTLSNVGLVNERDTLTLDPDGHSFSGRLRALRSGQWKWYAAGMQGPIGELPSPLELEVIPDSVPQVEILAPASDTVVLADASVPIRAAATDDHGIASVELVSRRRLASGREMPEVVQSLGAPRAPAWSGVPSLELAPRGLQPGDQVVVRVVATDNSPWKQSGASRELVLRVPSLSEQRERARALADSTVARITAAAKSERDLAQRTDEASRSRADRTSTRSSSSDWSSSDEAASQPRSMSYQSAEQAKTLAEEQRDLQQRVQQAQRDAAALRDQLRAAGVLDSSLTQQLRDVQRLLQDALTPELQQQLSELMNATNRLSAEDTRRALANLARQQEQLRQQLERSAEMLKRAALEGSLQTLHDEAREIAQQERAAGDSLARGQSRPDPASERRAQELSERSAKLSQDLTQLSERLKKEQAESGPRDLRGAPERADSSAASMKRAAGQRGDDQSRRAGEPRQADQQQPRDAQSQQQSQQRSQQQTDEQRRQELSQQLQRQAQGQQGQSQSAQSQQQQDPSQRQASPSQQSERAQAASQAARQMEQVAQQLGDARKSQINEWKNEITSQLDRSIQETMQLARTQKEIAQRAQQPQGQEQELKADQSAVQQGVEKVQERLQKAARQSAHISAQSQGAVSAAKRSVEEATRQVAEGETPGSSGQRGLGRQETVDAMADAAQALERAAAAMMQDRSRAASGQSASGFAEMVERMREAAKQQGGVNQQSAGLLPIPGGQPSQQMMAQARQLARQQREIARQLEGSGEGESGSRAAQLAKEMRDIARSLDRGRVDQGLLQRQQQLFHKLLDAGLTLQKDEREDNGERESQTAVHDESITTGTESSGRTVERYREPGWRELKGLTADERRAVLEYFKRINAGQPPENP
ncbi:MAG TPA: Ig-like domain-containing protein [Gemmatimonadaceae bacterium]|nr:Ig-like domain-containing protein [Gemmatimonadaceae bacterium]